MEYEEQVRFSEQIFSLCGQIQTHLQSIPGIYAKTSSNKYCFKLTKSTDDDQIQNVRAYSVYRWIAGRDFCNEHYLIFEVEEGFYFWDDESYFPFQPIRYRDIEIWKQYPMSEEIILEHGENMLSELGLIATSVEDGMFPVFKR